MCYEILSTVIQFSTHPLTPLLVFAIFVTFSFNSYPSNLKKKKM